MATIAVPGVNDWVSNLALDPTKEIPDNPNPSSPLIAPNPPVRTTAGILLIGIIFVNATPKLLSIPWELKDNIPSPYTVINAESPK